MRVLVRLVLVASVVVLAPRAEARVLDEPGLHFKLTIPDDFAERPDGAKGHTLHVFSRDAVKQAISIDRLEGTIGREPLTAQQVARFANLGVGATTTTTLVTMPWKTFDVSVARIEVKAAGREALVYAAQVPLRAEAIQINVVGEPASSTELEAIMRGVLASVEGESNWLTDAERSRKLGQGLGQVALVVVAIVALLAFAIRRTRKA